MHDMSGETQESAELPPDPPAVGHTVPGALVLPPAPPVGTAKGKDPTPHKVKSPVFLPPEGKAAQSIAHSEQQPSPDQSRSPRPQKLTKEPTGQPDKTGLIPVRLALTVGSASTRGQIPMTVMVRAHLPLGTPGDVIDPPLPPAKGTPRSLTIVPQHRPMKPTMMTRVHRASQAIKKQIQMNDAPRRATIRLARNSQGVKNGSLQPLPATPLPDSSQLIGDGSGLKGEYYEGTQFDQFEFSRADANVAFDWIKTPTQSPGPKVAAFSDYTVRWTGRIVAPYSETYTFYAAADDGVRVWINHTLVIDKWAAHGLTEFSSKFTFRAGEQYLFKCEYLEIDGGEASVYLYWESPHTPKEFVPEDAFFYPLPTDEADLKLDKAPY